MSQTSGRFWIQQAANGSTNIEERIGREDALRSALADIANQYHLAYTRSFNRKEPRHFLIGPFKRVAAHYLLDEPTLIIARFGVPLSDLTRIITERTESVEHTTIRTIPYAIYILQYHLNI